MREVIGAHGNVDSSKLKTWAVAASVGLVCGTFVAFCDVRMLPAKGRRWRAKARGQWFL